MTKGEMNDMFDKLKEAAEEEQRRRAAQSIRPLFDTIRQIGEPRVGE